MRIEVLLWAHIRIAAGTARLTLELPAGSRVEDALATLDAAHPAVAAARGSARIAVGNEYAEPGTELRDGDEISLIPPVQGG